MAEPTPNSDRLFQPYDSAAYALAQRIERGEHLNASDFGSVRDRLDERYGQDITLLFHALNSGNVDATIALIDVGADLRVTDRAEGSSRDFIYYLSLPGGELIDQDGMNRLLRGYLAAGGDPDVRLQGSDRMPLIAQMGMGGMNLEGVRILLDAGADPWAQATQGSGLTGNLLTMVNSHQDQFSFYDELIDKGYFDNRTQDELFKFLSSLGSYAQRGDEISAEIQRIAMRVLKRNQDYIETSDRQATARIFKDHWQNPEPGVIPWETIRSDVVD
ncbi:hypothetical protein EU803_18270 [Loktanella sp. IMCC34160]|uniref:hypothetical protein n=1 Tax=Loktanella sp. IMCC34160 TaxID=2510646 RepID=UPI00101D465A|nr:hypothetical protein [Loktanella sp. IMCC34160]RYG89194.1 hypothetical protein EU803_18270 [Loktanella sp. IMCC34160]